MHSHGIAYVILAVTLALCSAAPYVPRSIEAGVLALSPVAARGVSDDGVVKAGVIMSRDAAANDILHNLDRREVSPSTSLDKVESRNGQLVRRNEDSEGVTTSAAATTAIGPLTEAAECFGMHSCIKKRLSELFARAAVGPDSDISNCFGMHSCIKKRITSLFARAPPLRASNGMDCAGWQECLKKRLTGLLAPAPEVPPTTELVECFGWHGCLRKRLASILTPSIPADRERRVAIRGRPVTPSKAEGPDGFKPLKSWFA